MIWLILSPYLLWIFYLAIMSLFRARDEGKISKPVEILAYPIFIVGVLFDFIFNVFVLSILFAEHPKEWLVTKRLSRHKYEEGYRGKLSRLICSKLLDPFDPSGVHCK